MIEKVRIILVNILYIVASFVALGAFVGAIATILKGYAFLSMACSALSIASYNLVK